MAAQAVTGAANQRRPAGVLQRPGGATMASRAIPQGYPGRAELCRRFKAVRCSPTRLAPRGRLRLPREQEPAGGHLLPVGDQDHDVVNPVRRRPDRDHASPADLPAPSRRRANKK